MTMARSDLITHILQEFNILWVNFFAATIAATSGRGRHIRCLFCFVVKEL